MTTAPAPDVVLAPSDAHGEPTNSIDAVYPADHPRELSVVQELQRREQKMREAGDVLSWGVGWLIGLLEQRTGEDWTETRKHIMSSIESWREACRHG